MGADLLSDDVGHLTTDVAIVGAGVAGQTLAVTLLDAGHDVVLLEAGGRDFDAKAQDAVRGFNVGQEYYDLETTRLRLFGGTAAIWGGRCAEMDAIDFEKRDYLAHSGWPFGKAELQRYYDDVFKELGLESPKDGRLWDVTQTRKPGFQAKCLDADMWVFDEDGERFTNRMRRGLNRATLVLNAPVTEVAVGNVGEVKQIAATSLSGKTATVRAKAYVLAAGAIDTVRLLMGSVGARPEGLGNEHDVLGRYFMEHPHARGGEIVTDKLAEVLTLLPRAKRVGGKRYAAYARPSEAVQRERGVLNSSLSIAPRRHEGERLETFRAVSNRLKHDLPSSRGWRSSYKWVKGLAVKGLEWTDPWSSVLNIKLSGKLGLYAIIRAEQSPNPESRVSLSVERDALGQRLPVLDWQFQDIDKRSVAVLMGVFGAELERMGLGHVEAARWLSDAGVDWACDPLISSHPIGGYHHMGGVRMGENIRESVVDADCRLHVSPNLFVAGSSVFPTSGWANPTVTIMALAKRLGDHLDGTLKAGKI